MTAKVYFFLRLHATSCKLWQCHTLSLLQESDWWDCLCMGYWRPLPAPKKEKENMGKPHNASESCFSEVAHVTSGHFHWPKRVIWPSLPSIGWGSTILPQRGAVNILNITIYHRSTKQIYEAKSLVINENEKRKVIGNEKTRHGSNLRS